MTEIDRSTVEVVVVLDGSVDDSQTRLDAMVPAFPVPLRVLWKPNGGLASARNALVKAAVGELIWFLDDDMIVSEAAFRAHRRWDRNIAPVAFGSSHVIGNEGLRLFYEYRWMELAGKPVIDDPSTVSFANTSAPRSLLLSHPFDERLVGYGFEDYELGLRLLDENIGIHYLDEAPVTHFNDKSGFAMLRDIREEGINRVRVNRIHGTAADFALDLRPGRLARLLRPTAEKGWSQPLWYAAHVVRAAALPLRGERSFRVIRIADDLALYSGLALGWADAADVEGGDLCGVDRRVVPDPDGLKDGVS